MPTIDNLPLLGALALSDQFVVWSPASGDSRRTPYNSIKTDILDSVTADFASVVATFSNKTINLNDNILTGTIAQFNAACSDADFQTTGYTATWTGAVARTIAGRLGDVQSVKDFGAVGNDVANDTAAITAANATTARKHVPAGTYDTTIAATDLRGPFLGEGQIRDAANNKRAPWFSAIAAPPASEGNWDSIETASNGDLSKMQRVSEHRISGATTLGQPTTGYKITREAGAESLYVYISPEAGHNQGTATNDGRTGAVPSPRQIFHAGNGDAFANWASVITTGTKTGSTHWLANPAVVLYGGQAFGGADGGYLQGLGDLIFDDQGYDVAVQGLTFNFVRSNKTGAKQTDWTGIRLQTQGTEAVNAWAAFVGEADIGIDVSKSDFGATEAFIAMADGHRIYGNASNADSFSLSRNTVLGDDWFGYQSGIDAWNFVVNNASVFQIGIDRLAMQKPPVLPTVLTSGLPAAATRAGMEYYVSDANATTRLSTVVGGGSNFVKVFSNGTNWLIA